MRQHRQTQTLHIAAHLFQIRRDTAVHFGKHPAFAPQIRNFGSRLKRLFRIRTACQQHHLRIQLRLIGLIRRLQHHIRLLLLWQQGG